MTIGFVLDGLVRGAPSLPWGLVGWFMQAKPPRLRKGLVLPAPDMIFCN